MASHSSQKWWARLGMVGALVAASATFVTIQPAFATSVTTYPAPNGISASSHFSARVNDGSTWQNSMMYYVDGTDSVGTSRYISFTNFEMSGGSVTVEVTDLQGSITSATVRPKKYGIVPSISGNKLTFTLTSPQKVAIEVNGSNTDMLYIFGNAPDGGEPSGTTYYYGPGVYDAGVVQLNSNEKVYVAGGAYVKGVFQFKDGTSGQQILGPGIISGENQKNVGASWSMMNGTKKNSGWSFANTSGQTIKDVTFIKPAEPFLMWLVDGSLVQNVKFIAHPDNGRGNSVGGSGGIAIYGKNQPFTLNDCFAFASDDGYKYEYNDVDGSVVKNSTIGYAAGAPLGGIWNDVLGSNTRGVAVENSDVVMTSNNNYADNVGVVYAMSDNVFGTHGPIYNLRFSNIAIGDDATPFNRLVGFQASSRGSISNVSFNNIDVKKVPEHTSNLTGYSSTYKVQDVDFTNVRINGTLLTDANKSDFLNINTYTSNISFSSDFSGGTYTDDNSSALVWNGTWTADTSRPSSFGGGDRYSNTSGGYVEYGFSGQSVSWVARKNQYTGIAAVFVDGVFQQNIDLYAASEKYQQNVYTVSGLSNGSHTIRIVNTGTQNASASDHYLDVDAFVVGIDNSVNDTSKAITYGGTWTHDSTITNSFHGEDSYSNVSGALAEFEFNGTSISWIARKNQYTGIIGVYIDGVFQQNVDLYSSAETYQQNVYTATGLSSTTPHKIKLVVTGTKNSSALGTYVDLDRFLYK